MNLLDTFKHKGQRAMLVNVLKEKGITSSKVLDAIGVIPRHLFMVLGLDEKCYYQDKAFKIGAEQTISQPYTVAYQTQLLDLKAGDKVLEIGTGSGYQTAVLLELGVRVFTIERIKELYVSARSILSQLKYNPHFHYGDGFEGLPSYGPFDKILITAGAAEMPETLLAQLKIGGVMVIPFGAAGQTMLKITRTGEAEFKKQTYGGFSFVPMLKGKE